MDKAYIEREKIFPNGVFFASAEDPLATLDELIKRIWSIPAADVVEVVRCKDCKHYIKAMSLCTQEAGMGDVRDKMDFCSCGERWVKE